MITESICLKEENEQVNKKSIYEYLFDNIDYLTVVDNGDVVGVSKFGVDFTVYCNDSRDLSYLIKESGGYFRIFNKTYNVINKENSLYIFSEILDEYCEQSFIDKVSTFINSIKSGSGISFIGSPSIALNQMVIFYIKKRLMKESCHLINKDNKFSLLIYDSEKQLHTKQIDFDEIGDAVKFIESASFKDIFLDVNNSNIAIKIGIELSITGKNIICCTPAISSVYAIYMALMVSDKNILANMFSGAFFFNSLPLMNEVILPKIKFKDYCFFDKWSVLETAPDGMNLILKDSSVCNVLDLAKNTTFLAELILPNKDVNNLLLSSISPSDLAENLRILNGWTSISDEAMMLLKEEGTTIEQIEKKIKLI